jgi:hypothetical protein
MRPGSVRAFLLFTSILHFNTRVYEAFLLCDLLPKAASYSVARQNAAPKPGVDAQVDEGRADGTRVEWECDRCR